MILAVAPPVALAAAYFSLSDRPWDIVISTENLTRSTPNRPFPIFGLACAAGIVLLFLWHVVSLACAGGKLLWVRDGDLRIASHRKIPVASLRGAEVSLKAGAVIQNLYIKRRAGSAVHVPLLFGKYDRDRMLERLNAIFDDSG